MKRIQGPHILNLPRAPKRIGPALLVGEINICFSLGSIFNHLNIALTVNKIRETHLPSNDPWEMETSQVSVTPPNEGE